MPNLRTHTRGGRVRTLTPHSTPQHTTTQLLPSQDLLQQKAVPFTPSSLQVVVFDEVHPTTTTSSTTTTTTTTTTITTTLIILLCYSA